MSLREALYAKIMAIREAQRATAAREARKAQAFAAAPAAPPADHPSSAQAQPVAPSKPPPLTGKAAAFAMGCYCGPGGSPQSIDHEFPPDVATTNWRRSLAESKPVKSGGGEEIDPTDAVALEAAWRRQQIRVVK
jgi:hypothetical protein